MKKVALVLLGVMLAGYCTLNRASGVSTPDPIDPESEPVQERTDREPFEIETSKGPVKLQPRAEFDVSAIVASAESYRFDAGAFLSPVDLVMTWGKLPEEPYKGQVSYSQMSRFYYWRTPSSSVDLGYIQSHSSNMHMIPATPNLKKALRGIGSGDRVRLRGLLVDASTAEGFTWGTSMSRTDSGAGACELVWVEEAQVEGRVYR
jgi:hypothetical protein